MRDGPMAGGSSIPEDIVPCLDFALLSNPVDAPLKALGL